MISKQQKPFFRSTNFSL